MEDADKDDAGDDVQVVIELLRKQHGQYSGKATERAKNIKQYLKDQITTMQNIYEVTDIDNSANMEVNSATILKENNHPHVSLTIEECEMAITNLKAELKNNIDKQISAQGEDVQGINTDTNIIFDLNSQIPIPTHEDKIVISKEQREVIQKLRTELQKSPQLLAMVQGEAGSGKSTMARTFTRELHLRTLFSATTGTAAAPLKALTINSLLALGLSKDHVDLTKDTTSNYVKAKLQRIFKDIRVLIIDEISMCTPVTLARIDNRLRECLNPNMPFGNLHVILLGDFWQFEPVSFFLRKPALYQGLVQQARSLRLENNEAYRVGVNIFSTFKVFFLSGQQRAKNDPGYHKFLTVLRDLKKEYPINTTWIKKLLPLTKKDVDSSEK